MNIYDIAQRAGVSIATVSRVINGSTAVSNKTRQKVNKVMAELGYTPNIFARGLMVDSMKTIGVLTTDVRDLYYARAVQVIEAVMRQRGYDVILCSTGENVDEKKKYLQLLLQKRVDGIILVGSIFKEKNNNLHIVEASQKMPIVIVNGDVASNNVYSILNDDSHGICNAVNFLISKGYKALFYLYDADTFSGYEKINGFKKGVRENKLVFSQEAVIKVSKGIEGGYLATKKLLEQKNSFLPSSSAILTSEDIIAAGVLKALRESHKSVPSEVAVIGYGNSVISECTNPCLTSIDNKVEATSSHAANMMADILEEKNVPSKTILMPDLVVRETT